jgi:protein TonB
MLLLSIPLIISKLTPAPKIDTPVLPPTLTTLVEIELPDEVIPPKTPTTPPPQQKVATQKFVNPVITNKIDNIEEFPDQELLNKTNVGTVTQDGDTGTDKPAIDVVVPGNGTGEVVETKVFTFVEQMPEFPGGEAAMQKYLVNNMEYPAIAKRNNVQGLVVLSFIVNQQGEISDIQVLKNLGGGTDAEAIRVVKMMPPWKPGKNNGIPVNVRFTLPVKFSLR